jgi:hypothetical protein
MGVQKVRRRSAYATAHRNTRQRNSAFIQLYQQVQ